MKKVYLFLVQVLIALSLVFAVSCEEDNPGGDPEKPPVTSPDTPVKDPGGTITANISATTSITVSNVGQIKWIGPDNFDVSCSGGYSMVSICNLGEMKGLGNITGIPQTGFTAPQSSNTTVACETGYGYVMKFEGTYAVTQYVYLYVAESIVSTLGGLMGAKVKYHFTVEPTTLTVSTDSFAFTKEEGSQSITVTTNASDWWYSCDASWISLEKNDNTLSVSVDPNNSIPTERTGIINIITNDKQQLILIEQSTATLTVSTELLSFTRDQGTQTTTITTDAPEWTYSCDASWVSLEKNGNTLSVSVQNNNSIERTGTITIQADAQRKDIVIKQVEVGITTTTSAPYLVGDYYNETGVSGVVYKVTDDGAHGMIVSLEETSCAWSTEYVTTGCSDASNGMNNMNIIKSITGWESKYPAFKWCDDLNTGNVSGWYLPAKDELNDLYVSKTAVNVLLGRGYGIQLSSNYYWSSSEYNTNNAWYQNFNNGNQNNNNKNNTYRVRAVRDFK